VEALDMPVLHRPAGLEVHQPYLPVFCPASMRREVNSGPLSERRFSGRRVLRSAAPALASSGPSQGWCRPPAQDTRAYTHRPRSGCEDRSANAIAMTYKTLITPGKVAKPRTSKIYCYC
jgi:hypothetical protein